jgi:arginyl-tRNA synthetase
MITEILAHNAAEVIESLYGQKVQADQIQIEKTNKDFTGDYTVVVFPFLKISRKAPEATANEIGAALKNKMPEICNYNAVKGFLNIVFSDQTWLDLFSNITSSKEYGIKTITNEKPVVVEFSSPNTNKPLHLGHIRNNLLGWSVSQILKANGQKVCMVNLVNDRGIHICKSMLAHQLFGNHETPDSSGLKGDKLVGKYYVEFDKRYKEQINQGIEAGLTKEQAEQQVPLMVQAKEMLKKWEDNDPEIRKLWNTMNSWVYKGFDVTYKNLGISFDKTYYESLTYLLGKELVEQGLQQGAFIKKDDGSVWIDLSNEGLDEKLLLRSDGTSVYITQDMGTAVLRYKDYSPKNLIYVVGNEQNYHFDVLKKILARLGYEWAKDMYHLSYGMVELPEGKMKSREGTVVDADDLIDEMTDTARITTTELGKTDDFSEEESEKLFRILGLGALKYFILKVDPKKNMTFNPQESIDFNGNTGPFIQYTHARIRSVIRKAGENELTDFTGDNKDFILFPKEKNLIKLLHDFPEAITIAAESLDPSNIANYVYELAKEFNGFYHEHSILNEPDAERSAFRLALSNNTAKVISSSMKLLGIEVPERM